MQREIQPFAGPQQILNLFVGFGAAKGRIELGKDNFRNAQAQRAGQFASNQFGDEGFGALTRTPKL